MWSKICFCIKNATLYYNIVVMGDLNVYTSTDLTKFPNACNHELVNKPMKLINIYATRSNIF